MSLLEVKNLSHSYGDKVLYHDASFELYNGEHMGLVGQNGAGRKSEFSQTDMRRRSGFRLKAEERESGCSDKLSMITGRSRIPS